MVSLGSYIVGNSIEGSHTFILGSPNPGTRRAGPEGLNFVREYKRCPGGLQSARSSRTMKSAYHNVALVGLDGAGKTAILDQWNRSGAVSGPETGTFALRRVRSGQHDLRFWDFSGKPENRTCMTQAACHGDFAAIVLVLDGATQHRFQETMWMLVSMLQAKAKSAPLVILVNQQNRDSLPLEVIKSLFNPSTTLINGRRRTQAENTSHGSERTYVWSSPHPVI